jgi:hypothetical protein
VQAGRHLALDDIFAPILFLALLVEIVLRIARTSQPAAICSTACRHRSRRRS